jgi:hypothetical protein
VLPPDPPLPPALPAAPFIPILPDPPAPPEAGLIYISSSENKLLIETNEVL